MKKIILLSFLFLSCISSAQENPKPSVTTYGKHRVSYKKALKDPAAITRIRVKDYTDPVFPSDEILVFRNLEIIRVTGGYKKNKTGDTLSARMLMIDSVKLQQLPNLKELWIDDFDLSTGFPEAVCSVKNLQDLSLLTCKIPEVPASIARLTELRSLSMRVNELTTLPAALDKLAKLENLDMGNNKFTRVPLVIAKLPALRILNLQNAETSKFVAATPKVPFNLNINQIDLIASYPVVKQILSAPQFQLFYAEMGICKDTWLFYNMLTKDQLTKNIVLIQSSCK